MPNLPITDIVSIYHFTRTGNVESYEVSPSYTNVNATITPAGNDIQAMFGGMEGFQLFEIFIYDTNVTVKNGDKLTSRSGVTYLVSGVPLSVNNRYLSYQKIVGKVVV